jgi:hypothetical protein
VPAEEAPTEEADERKKLDALEQNKPAAGLPLPVAGKNVS